MEAVLIKTMQQEHWEKVKQVYESGIATGFATFETTALGWEKWNEEHLTFGRRVAVNNNEIAVRRHSVQFQRDVYIDL